MAQDNLRKFDAAALNILSNLYQVHPVKMHGNDLAGLTHALNVVWEAFEKSDDPAEEYFDFIQVTDETLEWLEAERFIRFERIQGQRQPVNVQLTGVGFAAIQKISQKRWWGFWKPNRTFSEHVTALFEKPDAKGMHKLMGLALDAVGIALAAAGA